MHYGLIEYRCLRPYCNFAQYEQLPPTGGEEERENEKPKDDGSGSPSGDDLPGTGLTDPPGPDVVGPEGQGADNPGGTGSEGPATGNPGTGNPDPNTHEQKPEGPITENPGPFVPNLPPQPQLPNIIVVTPQGLGGIPIPIPVGLGLSAANPQAQGASGGGLTLSTGVTSLYEGDGCVFIGVGVDEINRAPLTSNAFASIIWQLCGEPEERLEFRYEDVNASDAMIRWVVREGIFDAEADTYASVQEIQKITKRDFFTVLWRLARSELLLPPDNLYRASSFGYHDPLAWARAMNLEIGGLRTTREDGIVMLADAFMVFDLLMIE